MKKVICILLALLMFSGSLLCACQKTGTGDESTGAVTTAEKDGTGTAESGSTADTGTEPPAPEGDPNMHTWMSDGFVTVMGEDKGPEENVTSHTIYMAKNETESAQISLRASERYNGMKFAMTGEEIPGISVDYFWENILVLNGKEWPDPLSPIDAKNGMSLRPNMTRGILVQVKTAEDLAAGDYDLHFALTKKDGSLIHNYTLTVHVWDFAYPTAPSMASAVGIDTQSIAYQFGYITESNDPIPEDCQARVKALYKSIYDLLLDYKITGMILPYEITDPLADAYLDDPRVTGLYIDCTDKTDDQLKEIYDKLCTKDEWIGKAYMYPVDEPTSVAMMDEIYDKVTHYRSLFPRMKFATSYFCNYDHDAERDETQFLSEILDILCLKTKCWRDADFYSAAQAAKYPTMTVRTRQLQEQGKTIWSYVCWEPGFPYTNLFVDESGLNHRILFWQQYMVGSEGFLYWCANFWKCMTNTWTSMSTVSWLDPYVYGDGSLLYAGQQVNVFGACPSKRLECVRDGIEDYELFRMAAEALGQDYVDREIDKVVTDMINYTKNSKTFIDTRIAVGEALEAALKK